MLDVCETPVRPGISMNGLAPDKCDIVQDWPSRGQQIKAQVQASADQLLDAVRESRPVAGARTSRNFAVQAVFVIAVAVVLVAGVVSAAAVAAFCAAKGYDRVEYWGPNSWRVWEIRVVCARG